MKIPPTHLLLRALGALVIFTTAFQPGNIRGALLTVANSSFENPSTGSFTNGNANGNGVDPAVMANWNFNSSTSSSYGVQLSSTAQFSAGQITGAQFGYLNSNDTQASITSANIGTVSLNTNYTLTVALGKRADNPTFTNEGQFTLSILVNGNSVASKVINGTTLTAGALTDSSLLWNSGATNTGILTAQIAWNHTINASASNTSQGPFDNVRFDATAVPEPAPAAFVLVAAAAFAALRLRRAAARKERSETIGCNS